MIKFYVTYDSVSEQFSMPFPAKNDNVAVRNLLIASKRENLPLSDIQLYCIGSYDSDKGLFIDSDRGIQLPQIEVKLPSVHETKQE